MRAPCGWALAGVLLLSLAANAEDDKRPRLAVLGLRASAGAAEAASSLTGLLGTEITRLGRFQVTSADDVRGLVAAAALAQALGCDGDACAPGFAAIGAALNAGRLVAGSVGRVGDSAVVNLALLDARTGKVENRSSVTAPSLEALPAALRGGVLALFGIAGQLVLWGQPDGAQVLLDEKLVGTAPVGKIDLPREGEYTVRVYRDDATPFERTVSVKAGEVVRVKVESWTFRDLDGAAKDRRRWGWGLVAGGAAAAVTGGVLLGLAVRSDRRIDALDLRKPEDVATGREYASTTFGLTMGSLAAFVVGVGAGATGGWLLASNPWQKMLDRFALAPVADGAVLVAAAQF